MGDGNRWFSEKGREINKPRKYFITGDYSPMAKRHGVEATLTALLNGMLLDQGRQGVGLNLDGSL